MDFEKTIWVGTENGGLNRIQRNDTQFNFTKYTTNELLDTEETIPLNVWSIFEDKNKLLF